MNKNTDNSEKFELTKAEVSQPLILYTKQKDVDTCPVLSATEVRMVVASKATKVCELPKKDFAKEIKNIVAITQKEAGFKFKESELGELSFMVADEILAHHMFRNLTLSEIKLACEKGVREEYGQYMGLSLITYHKWFKAFMNEERGRALIKQREYETQKLRDESKIELSNQERSILTQTSITHSFEVFKTSRKIVDFGNVNYDNLRKLGLLELSEKEQKRLFNEAKLIIITAQKEKAIVPHQRVHKKSIIEYIDKITKGEKTVKEDIVIQAKKLALKEFYINLIRLNQEKEFFINLAVKLGLNKPI